MTNLDSGEAHQTWFLALEPLEDGVRVVAIHVGLLHKWEVYTMIKLAERCNRPIITGLLASKRLMLSSKITMSCVCSGVDLLGCMGTPE
jgi:hypothetical protein